MEGSITVAKLRDVANGLQQGITDAIKDLTVEQNYFFVVGHWP
jgi:hypothetical protein